MPHTPRHWTGRKRKVTQHTPQHARPELAKLDRMAWQPIPESELGQQAITELADIAHKRDAWSGSRDTDRRA